MKAKSKSADLLTESEVLQVISNNPKLEKFLIRSITKEPPFMRRPRRRANGKPWRYKGAGERLREHMIRELMPDLLRHLDWNTIATKVMMNYATQKYVFQYFPAAQVRVRSK